jgi:tyrosinase
VYYFERIIRKVLDDDDFTLPYWDYTAEGKKAIPEQFRRPNDSDYTSLFRDNRNRGHDGNPDVNAGEALDINAPGVLNLGALGELEFEPRGVASGFSALLNGRLHGAIHVLVGDQLNMGDVPWAARDPIFWLHHCNIDRLWASWNAGGRSNPTGPWLNQAFVFADEDGSRVESPVGEFTDTKQIKNDPYGYDRLEPLPPLPLAPAAASISSLAPTMIAAQAQPGPIFLNPEGSVPVDLAPVKNFVPAAVRPVSEDRRKAYLVLEDLSANAQPGVLYKVSIKGRSEPVGTFNFFNAVTHGVEHQPPPASYSFEVTDLVKSGAINSADKLIPTLIEPIGTAQRDAQPKVGSLKLVLQ